MFFRFCFILLFGILSAETMQKYNIEYAKQNYGMNEEQARIYAKQKELYFLKGQEYELALKKAQILENSKKNGILLGVSLGSFPININKGSSLNINGYTPMLINPLALGLSVAYIKNIADSAMSFRVGGAYLWANAWGSNLDKGSVDTHLLSFTIEMLGERPIGYKDGNFIGFYAGVGIGSVWYNQTINQNISNIHAGSIINAGLSLTIDYNNRFEAGIRLAPNTFNTSYDFKTIFLVTYLYRFGL